MIKRSELARIAEDILGLLAVISAAAIIMVLFDYSITHAQTPHGTMYEETPQGAIDGVNNTFTIAHQPLPWAAIKLYRNGLRLKRAVVVQGSPTSGIGDYSLDTTVFSNTKIVFQTACTPSCIPQPGDILLADYTY
jgi:hypothetical protein